MSDCIGGCKGYAWTNGGQGVLEAIGTDKTITSKYGSNGCLDKGANSMFTWAKSKGMDWAPLTPCLRSLVWRCIRTVMPGTTSATVMPWSGRASAGAA